MKAFKFSPHLIKKLQGKSGNCREIVIILDADLQNPPEEISRLAAKIDEGFDVVGSVRLERQDNLFRKISSLIINAN